MHWCHDDVIISPCRPQKLQIRRMTATGTDDADPLHGGKPCEREMDNDRVLISLSAGNNAVSDVERTLKSLNGYHEDILEALRNAASSHRSSGNTPSGRLEIIEQSNQKKNYLQ